MPSFDSDGVHIFYQSTGEGFPLIWSHEFAGSHESWEQQVRYFSHRYRVITYTRPGLSALGCAHRPGGVLAGHHH